MESTKPMSKINLNQKKILGDFMMRHPKLAQNITPNCIVGGKTLADRLWNELATKLNAEGPPCREAKLWRRVYTDIKHNIKRKITVREENGEYVKRRKIYLSKIEQQIIVAAALDTTDLESLPPLCVQAMQKESQSETVPKSLEPHCTNLRKMAQTSRTPSKISSIDQNNRVAIAPQPKLATATVPTVWAGHTHQLQKDTKEDDNVDPEHTQHIRRYSDENIYGDPEHTHLLWMDSDEIDYIDVEVDDDDIHDPATIPVDLSQIVSQISPDYVIPTSPVYLSTISPDYHTSYDSVYVPQTTVGNGSQVTLEGRSKTSVDGSQTTSVSEDTSSTSPTTSEQYMLHLLTTNIHKFEESQELLNKKLEKLITNYENSIELKEKQHVANMAAKKLELEIKTLEFEMLKTKSMINL